MVTEISLSKCMAASAFAVAGGSATAFTTAALPVAGAVVSGAAIMGLAMYGFMSMLEKPTGVSLKEDWKEAGKRRAAISALTGGALGMALGGSMAYDAQTEEYLNRLPILDPRTVLETRTIEITAEDKFCSLKGRRQEVEFNGQKYALTCK